MNKNVGGISQFNADYVKANAAVQNAKSGRTGYNPAAQGLANVSLDGQFVDPGAVQYEHTATPTYNPMAMNSPNAALVSKPVNPTADVSSMTSMFSSMQVADQSIPAHNVSQNQLWMQQQQHQQQQQQQQHGASMMLQQQTQMIESHKQALLQKQTQQMQHAQQMQQMQQLQQMQQMQQLQQMQQMQLQQQQLQQQQAKQAQDQEQEAFSFLRSQALDGDLQTELEDQLMDAMSGSSRLLSPDTIQEFQTSSNDKWRNSKFLKFVDQIQKGELKFEDDTVVEASAAEADLANAVAKEFQNVVGDVDMTEDWDTAFLNSQYNPYTYTGDEEEIQRNAPQVYDDLDNEALATGERDWTDFLENLKYQEPQIPAYIYSYTPTEAMELIYEEGDQASEEMTADNALLRGIEFFEAGRINNAIACFETSTRLNEDNSEAWRWLGQSWAQNEEDSQAIACLERAIAVDPYNLQALLMLGVSHTNNLDGSRAIQHLKTWLLNHPDYAYIDLDNNDEVVEMDTSKPQGVYDNAMYGEVIRLFKKATEVAPLDADLWTVLGVLRILSSDYDHAVLAFQEATKLRSDDPELWNKLGATLANSNRGSEAVAAYERALTSRPTYVRARANLAIAHYNEGQYWEAAKAFLTCLSENSSPSHLWSFLRMSLNYVGRDDLAEIAREKNVDLLRPHIDF